MARFLRLALLVTLLVSVLSGLARAGTTSWLCAAMGEMRSDPCCARKKAPAAPAIDRAAFDCCHKIVAPSLPSATTTPELAIATPPPLTIPTLVIEGRILAASTRSSAVTRPPDRPTRSRTMVFLI